jgi:hypothetical protein
MTTITANILVSVENGQIYASDLDVNDVGTGNNVVIVWSGDGVELEQITGLPSNVRLTGPDGMGHITGRYFAPTADATWDYTIHGIIEGQHFSHDPKIHNTTPT